VLAIDAVVAQRCARLHVPDKRAERDALIAATALVHGLTVATRNVADFEATGVALINPWLPSTSGWRFRGGSSDGWRGKTYPAGGRPWGASNVTNSGAAPRPRPPV
jgi:hypothetical protein